MNNIRNFAIVAHIDHGKSTLADRFLEITGTVQKSKMHEQFLDQNPISRERGITIKLAPVRMNYVHNSKNLDRKEASSAYILNLIDTPGHIDFSYEVSRTLSSCEGVILLVDATQGVQAQTVAHFHSAKKQNLKIIPVVNKIDMDIARVEETIDQMVEIFGFARDEILKVSARTGENVQDLLDAVVEKIPPPDGGSQSSLRALIFDAVYDDHRGVVAFVRVFDGEVKKGDKVNFLQSKVSSTVSDVGFFSPYLSPSSILQSGEIGYIVTGVKDIRYARVGDTISNDTTTSPLPGYKTPQPMVFFGVYHKEQNDLVKLKEGLNKLSLNDASLRIDSEYSSYLGSGFRVGFLGLLHAEIVKERLKKEEGIDPLFTKPQVLYKKDLSTSSGQVRTLEPYMRITIYTPKDYVGSLINLCEGRKGTLVDISYHKGNAQLTYEMPYSLLLANLTSDIKSITSGFASLDYEISDYKEADLVNLEILVNNTPIDVLSETVYRDEVQYRGREKVEKLKGLLPRQQFRQVIQARLAEDGESRRAKIGGNIIARSEIPPFRKDVLAKMSGGDRTRKDKLLKKQKKGKTKMQQVGRIEIPQKALFSLIES